MKKHAVVPIVCATEEEENRQFKQKTLDDILFN